MKNLSTFLILIFITINAVASSDSAFVKVYFLYGSKPKREYKIEEKKWFGGKLGGHVGLEIDSDKILSFLPNGNLHVFPKKNDKSSQFSIVSIDQFWSILGGHNIQNKGIVVSIPIKPEQKNKLNKIAEYYSIEPPYDYAFFGMRCASSTYEVLSKIDILKKTTKRSMVFRNFYPKKFRKRILKLAQKNNWKKEYFSGSEKRKWEND